MPSRVTGWDSAHRRTAQPGSVKTDGGQADRVQTGTWKTNFIALYIFLYVLYNFYIFL